MQEERPAADEGAKGFNPVPSMFTLCNALCGFTAIVVAFKGDGDSASAVPLMSLLLIGGAMVFDVLDGLAARVLDARSVHGLHLDSLADAVSFGAAPAVVVYQCGLRGLDVFVGAEMVAWLVGGLYLGCALWRLAAYNTRALAGLEKSAGAAFIGLPSPGAAAAVCGMALLLPAALSNERMLFLGYMAYGTVAALLMVSSVPYPHVRIFVERNGAWGPLLLAVFMAASLLRMGAWALVLWAHIYIFAIPLADMAARVDRRYELLDRLRYLVGR